MSARRRTGPLLGLTVLVAVLVAGLALAVPARTLHGSAVPAVKSADAVPPGPPRSSPATTDPDVTSAADSNSAAQAPTSTSHGPSSGPQPGPDGTVAEASTPAYEYAEAIREHLMVPTGLDNDGDGEPDQMSIDIVRPATPASVTVPVIVDSSPYFFTAGRGVESQVKELDADSLVQDLPLFYDNYFVPRGYAVVAMDNPGTGRSTGCMDVLGPEDIGAARAVVEFLAGSGTALADDGSAVSAAAWSNGRVAMVGKSYDGSVANGVAATGTAALTTIVTQSSISDTYHYARNGGIVRFPHWVGWYAENEQSAEQTAKCAEHIDRMNAAADDATGNYNEFWEQRNLLRDTSKWTASALISHGLTDYNVLADQSTELWTSLQQQQIPARMWLTQAGHVDPFDIDRKRWIDQVHAWFDHWLLGVDNGVMDGDPVLVQSAQDLSQWRSEPQWPPDTDPTDYVLGTPDVTGGLSPWPDPTAEPVTFTDDVDSSGGGDDDRSRGIRLSYLTAPLETDTAMSGVPRVRLSLRVADVDRAQVAIKLLDYGDAERIDAENGTDGVEIGPGRTCYSDRGTTGCFLDTSPAVVDSEVGTLSQGWYDLGHRASLREQTPIESGATVTLEFDLSPLDITVPAGHRLVLAVGGTDLWEAAGYQDPCAYNRPPAGEQCSIPGTDRPAKITVIPRDSMLVLPMSGR